MNRRLLLLLAVAASGPALDLSTEAEARRRVPAIIGWGESMTEVGKLPDEVSAAAQEATGDEVVVSYLYESVSIFFMNLWTWDGKYVLEGEDSYYELSDADWVDFGVDPEEDFGKPLSYRFPPAIVIVIVGIIFFIVGAIFGDGDE